MRLVVQTNYINKSYANILNAKTLELKFFIYEFLKRLRLR